MSWKAILYAPAAILAMFCLWIANNAMVQTRIFYPGETTGQELRALVWGEPVPANRSCPPEVHAAYTSIGPDHKTYPTWHPPLDTAHNCHFDHEHGSDPRMYTGFAASRLPVFGYSASKAGVQEPHAGYKVYVANDDLHGHAWMITINQDTSSPQRALVQFHTLDWHISSTDGIPLVDLHLMGDFGNARTNCPPFNAIPGSSQTSDFPLGQHRDILTSDCVLTSDYEDWVAGINMANVFEATPLFDVDNPITAVVLNDIPAVHKTCEFNVDEVCSPGDTQWTGNKRGVTHPGQFVHNTGPERFTTDPYGKPVNADSPNAILQYVTNQGWDTRECCGNQVVFRIQTYTGGVYIPDPSEPVGSVEFGYQP